MALPSWLLVFVGRRCSQRPGPSPTLGSLGPSHHRRHKSRVSLRGPPCVHGVSGTPHGEVRDTIRDRFQSLFENVLSRSFNSFFQLLDHQVDISCLSHRAYCTLLTYSREVVGLTPSWCTCSPTTLLASRTLTSISLHLHKKHEAATRSWLGDHQSSSINMENWLLVIDEPVEFEK
jgi:hypothetical protein